MAEAGQLKLSQNATALSDFIMAQIASVQSRCHEKRISIDTELPEELPEVLIDRDRIRQVFHNLIDNALRYTRAGGSIKIGASEGKSGWVTVYVSDSGSGIAADDFGKGYSSLSYLYQLPIDAIKIDQSFITRIGDKKINDLIKSMISMTHDLEMKVVAEGIETKEQLDFLQSIGCDYGQGWYFHPALSPEQGEELLINLDK